MRWEYEPTGVCFHNFFEFSQTFAKKLGKHSCNARVLTAFSSIDFSTPVYAAQLKNLLLLEIRLT